MPDLVDDHQFTMITGLIDTHVRSDPAAGDADSHTSFNVALIVIMCYSDSMKNITVSLDDEIYRRARIKAAEKDTSVSALVRGFLIQIATVESENEGRKRLQKETLAAIRATQVFRAADRLARDDLHNRHAIS